MSYDLEWKEEAIKDLKKLSTEERERIVDKLEWFTEHPDRKKNVKWIEKYSSLRYRVGDFRIFFLKHDEEEVIEILTIDRRPRAYR
ncbi:MAG: type II toxin-antitoxin system RelE family toxin [Candidatus Aenigmatarchaeota archaeon]